MVKKMERIRSEMKEFAEKCFGRFELLVRWILVAGPTGIILGIFGGLFGKSITIVTAFRNTHPWMLYLLPAAGLLIVAIYKLDPYKTGTNRYWKVSSQTPMCRFEWHL